MTGGWQWSSPPLVMKHSRELRFDANAVMLTGRSVIQRKGIEKGAKKREQISSHDLAFWGCASINRSGHFAYRV